MDATEISQVISWNQPQACWKQRFFVIWTGQAFSLLGSSLAGFALVWWLTTTTGSATVLAGSTFMMIVPQFLLSPLAGALVDRWSRRWVMAVADAGIALVSLGLVILFALGRVHFWHVYMVLFARAVGGAFHTPAMQATIPLLVPEKHLTRVAGINQTFQGVLNMISPPLAALLLGLLPIQHVLMMDVFTALMAVAPLLFVAVPNPPRVCATVVAGAPSLGSEIKAGLRFVWGWPGLLIIMSLGSALNFLIVPVLSFVPLLVTAHFRLGVMELGWIQTVVGLGVIAGGLLLGVWGSLKNRVVTILLALAGMGLGFLACGLAPRGFFTLALGGMLFGSLSSTVLNGLVFAMLQTIVPPAMQGRVFSLLLSAAAAMAPLGLLIAGPLVDRLGVPFWFVLTGAVSILTAMACFFVPAVLHLEETHPVGQGAG